jgi:putative spermidine/putrescine transport system permease protein
MDLSADTRARDSTEGTPASERSESGARWALWCLPALLLLSFTFVLPLLCMASLSLLNFTGPAQSSGPLTLRNFVDIVSDPYYLSVLGNTCLLGIVVVSLCIVLGYPVAYFLARTTSKWRTFLIFLVLGPLLISSVIRNLGWIPILGTNGFINWTLLSFGLISQPLSLMNNFIGVIVGTTHALLPFMILMLMAVIQRIHPSLEEAARSLGASTWSTFWRVIFPLSVPGLVSGYLIVFTLAISYYTTPAMLGGNRVVVMSTYIAQQVRFVLNYPLGAALAVTLTLLAAVMTVLALRSSERTPT